MRVHSKAVALLLAACLSSRSALASYHLDDAYVETSSTSTIFPTTAVDQDSTGLKVGDEVCVTNYIMDTFCIELGFLMDNPTVITLEHPEEHSYHCTLDIDDCTESGYVVLTDKNEETGMHCLGFRLDDSEAIIAAGRAKGAQGFCQSCTGAQGSPEYGYRATIQGMVKELGDGTAGVSGAPLLEVTAVLDDSEVCETTAVVHPVCMAPATIAPTPANAPEVDVDEAVDAPVDTPIYQLSDDLQLIYQINVPSDTTYEICDGCTISMEAIYDGEAWVAIAVSTDGLMIGSEAVIGIPGQDPQKYSLSAKSIDGVVPMPDSAQTLTDASVEVINGKTVMKFTKIMKETGEIEITTGQNIFLWAYGSSDILGFHAARSSFEFDLSSLSTTETGTPGAETGTPEVESSTPTGSAAVSSSKYAALALIGLTLAFDLL